MLKFAYGGGGGGGNGIIKFFPSIDPYTTLDLTSRPTRFYRASNDSLSSFALLTFKISTEMLKSGLVAMKAAFKVSTAGSNYGGRLAYSSSLPFSSTCCSQSSPLLPCSSTSPLPLLFLPLQEKRLDAFRVVKIKFTSSKTTWYAASKQATVEAVANAKEMASVLAGGNNTAMEVHKIEMLDSKW